MTNSLTTFETELRERLLNVLYSQWQQLGAPFNSPIEPSRTEIIDPEALLWCSLEFFPTEPRLREGVTAWYKAHKKSIIRRRIPAKNNPDDLRTSLWNDLENKTSIEEYHSPGDIIQTPSTSLFRARNILGNDAKHFLLICLLPQYSSNLLKDIALYSGYTYRNLADVANRWATAGIVSFENGYCRLTDPAPWCKLLKTPRNTTFLIPWFKIFDTLVAQLRFLNNAHQKNIIPNSPAIRSACRTTLETIVSARFSGLPNPWSITYLCEPLKSFK